MSSGRTVYCVVGTRGSRAVTIERMQPSDSSVAGAHERAVGLNRWLGVWLRSRSAWSRRARTSRSASGAFAPRALTAPPRDGWRTNGGNLYNQRYSPLDADRPRQRRAAQGRLAHASERLGLAPQYSGEAQPIVHDGVDLRHHGRRRRLRAVRRDRRDPLAAPRQHRSEDHVGLLRLDEPRRRTRRRQGFRRPARRPARRARPTDRQRGLGRFRPSGGKKGSRSRARRSTTTAW